METTQEFELRTYGDGTYGAGQVVTPSVTYFSKDNYGLTKEEAVNKLNKLRGKVVIAHTNGGRLSDRFSSDRVRF